MYSPKIAEDLIPILYREAKKQGKPMTRLINEFLHTRFNGGRDISSQELLELIRGNRIVLDCGHRFTLHPLSNTLILTCTGETMCHSCYD